MTPAAETGTPIEVDARGLLCPLPVIRLAEAARLAPPGARIVVLASDPAARHDIPAWCRMREHELLEMTEVPGTTDIPGMTEGAGSSGTGGSPAEGAGPAYLRFVVLLRAVPPQRSKAGGSGSGSARPSRAR